MDRLKEDLNTLFIKKVSNGYIVTENHDYFPRVASDGVIMTGEKVFNTIKQLSDFLEENFNVE